MAEMTVLGRSGSVKLWESHGSMGDTDRVDET